MKPHLDLVPAEPPQKLHEFDAENVYPKQPRMQELWLAAIAWMRSQPGHSRWLLDKRTQKGKK